MIPAFIVVWLGVNSTNALVLSQVVLSIALPAPVIALLIFTRRKDIMGLCQQPPNEHRGGHRNAGDPRAERDPAAANFRREHSRADERLRRRSPERLEEISLRASPIPYHR